jgi:hypothetical protein
MELHSEGGSRCLQGAHELLGNSRSGRIDKDGNVGCSRLQFAQQLYNNASRHARDRDGRNDARIGRAVSAVKAFYLCVKLRKMLPEPHQGLGMN